jgi:hypothetical protein
VQNAFDNEDFYVITDPILLSLWDAFAKADPAGFPLSRLDRLFATADAF